MFVDGVYGEGDEAGGDFEGGDGEVGGAAALNGGLGQRKGREEGEEEEGAEHVVMGKTRDFWGSRGGCFTRGFRRQTQVTDDKAVGWPGAPTSFRGFEN